MRQYTKAREDTTRENSVRDYNLAVMVASFVNCALGGQEIPDIYDMFPDTFSDEERDVAIMREMQQHMLKYVNKR